MQEPTQTAKNHSIKVTEFIKEKIQQAGGSISFADFMQAALYAPNLGYYNAGCEKFGKNGDFITAPMMGQLFAATVANQCSTILQTIKNNKSNILELGAGDGQLAYQLINRLLEEPKFNNYFILEPSAELQDRQKKFLLTKLNSTFKNRIFWLDALPENFNGIILANEVLDALPVHLFKFENNQIFEKMVFFENNRFIFKEVVASEQIINQIMQVDLGCPYNSEICLLLPGLIKSLSECLQQGVILLFDYGFLERSSEQLQRNLGTLRCYYRHHVHTDPFFFPGLQDITANVNFSLVIDHAIKNNLRVEAFSSIANFLMQNGLQREFFKLFAESNSVEQTKLNKEINTLISPNEMGEVFKALLLVKRV